MPTDLEIGILYFSEEFGAAAHLCACGCGCKIRTPIGPTEWRIQDGPKGVSLCPSVGNWQHPCKSHYWITDGEIEWRDQWTGAQILAGREREAARRENFFAAKQRNTKKPSFLGRLWRKLFQ